MSFKSWYDILEKEIMAYINDRSIDTKFKLTFHDSDGDIKSSLSPVTNNLLNTWSYLLDTDKNLIFNFPSNMLKSIPILAYIYSKVYSKSSLVFTSGNINLKKHIVDLHNQHYHLLGYSNEGFFYSSIPMGFISNKSIICKPYLLHASDEFKRENREALKNDFLSSNKPKILLNSADNLTKINSLINDLKIDNENFSDLNLDMDIGCIIFENADRFINSQYNARSFLDWLHDCVDENIKLIFHFSNFNLDFLPEIKKETNSFVLSFDNNVLKNNKKLYAQSIDYFMERSDYSRNFVKNYNVDTILNYEKDFNISVLSPSLENGNLDLYLYFAQRVLSEIDENNIKNKNFYYRAINLLYSLNNLAVDPRFFKFNIQINYGTWRYINVSQFISLFRSKLSLENELNRFLLNKLISNLNNFYNELIQCKNYFVDNNYERINKAYQVLDISFNKEEYFEDDKKLYIGVYQNTERRILNDFLRDVPDVEAIYLRDMYFKSENLFDFNLLLSGIITHKYKSILEHNFNQILILAYDGYNKNLINHQIDLVLNPSIRNEKQSMEYFEELYKFMNISRNNQFFHDFNKRYDTWINSSIAEEEHEIDDVNKENVFLLTDNYNQYTKGQENSNSKLSNTFSSSHSSSSNNYSIETIQMNLLNLNDDRVYTKNMIKSKKYLRFKDYNKLDEAMEVKPELLKKGEFVIVLEDNKSFLDIYAEIFDENIDLNRFFIDYWRDLLFDYKKIQKLSIVDLHKKYEEFFNENQSEYGPVTYQTFRLWVNGYTICPSNPYDLKVLAELFDDEYLNDNYEEMYNEGVKLRNFNRTMGRKLSSIIKNIIQNSSFIDYNMLSFEERNIFEQIKNGVYQVI